MNLICDLHIHSRFARAVSPQMTIPNIALWARKKGIGLVGTGDFTHPLWLRELKDNLIEVGEGIYQHKSEIRNDPISNNNISPATPPMCAAGATPHRGCYPPYFLLSCEIASVFTQNGKGRRIHTLVLAPNFLVVEKINQKLVAAGINLLVDGRPSIWGKLNLEQLAELIFSVSRDCMIIPAHLWTPWYGTYGDKGGFNSLAEAYGSYAEKITAIETGMSSDPIMNWRVKELDNRAILSFSDAHSLPKMGREATVLKLKVQSSKLKVTATPIYQEIVGAFKSNPKSPLEIAYTIEFYPEEGKYHYNGHRACGISQSPEETKQKGEICPVCGRQLTIGAMQRVEELANRSSKELSITETTIGRGVKCFQVSNRPPFVKLVPLIEILSEALGTDSISEKVISEYNNLTSTIGSEFYILLEAPLEKVRLLAGEKIADGLGRVRRGEIFVDPGYDGVFGTVKIWGGQSPISGERSRTIGQISQIGLI